MHWTERYAARAAWARAIGWALVFLIGLAWGGGCP